jgi:hypothetical protein
MVGEPDDSWSLALATVGVVAGASAPAHAIPEVSSSTWVASSCSTPATVLATDSRVASVCCLVVFFADDDAAGEGAGDSAGVVCGVDVVVVAGVAVVVLFGRTRFTGSGLGRCSC